MSVIGTPGYKETEIGWIPVAWAISSLETIATDNITYVVVQPGPEDEAGVPLVRGGDVKNGRVSSALRTISSKVSQQFSRTVLRGGELLVSLVGYPGETAIAGEELSGANIARQVGLIRLCDSVDSHFVQQYLSSPAGKSVLLGGMIGSAQQVINLNALREVKVPLPSLLEQKKIAATLMALDDKLDVIGRQIESTNALKQGMMQVLFGRGVGTEDTDGSWLPHTEFKDSELGEIPVSWGVLSLSDVVDNLDKQRIPLKQSDRALRKGKYPYYGASGVIDWIDEFIFDGDFILLGEDGENVLSRNLPLAFRATGKIWVNNHAHVFQPKSGFDIQFLVELLESIDYSHLASGTAQPKITQQALRQLRFAVPPYAEQRRIGAVLATVEDKLASLRNKLDHYQTLKNGLMQKLLTGEWRVKVETAVPKTEPEVTA